MMETRREEFQKQLMELKESLRRKQWGRENKLNL
jgi:hypothetical protein